MTRRWIVAACALVLGGGAAEVGRAAPGEAPAEAGQLSTQMTNDFAIALYRRLAASDLTRNVFFSPYSIASALMMAAEGARGRTAEEMGEALRFPTLLRREGDPQRPWNPGPLHEGLAGLNESLQGGDGEDAAIREEIARLRAELAELNRRAEAAGKARDWSGQATAARRAMETADRLNELLPLVDRYEVRVANALWVERTFPLRAAYEEALARHYATGGAIPVDFRKDPEAARARINEWVEDRTNRRIRDLLAPGVIDPLTRMVLTNAIYFQGEWSVPFPEAATKESDFLLADGGAVRLPLMGGVLEEGARYGAFEADGSLFATPQQIPWSQDEAELVARYPDEDGFAIVELPYRGGELSMIVIAPNRPDGLPAVEDALSSGGLSRWIAQLEHRKVEVRLPRFRLETSYGLVPALRELGMEAAFGSGADFSGMIDPDAEGRGLLISDVLHKAFVEVTEKGTEAAAATAVVMKELSVEPVLAFTPVFRADRPFVFLIRDRSSGAILFAGRMVRPEGT